jgi:hypothetical protein
MIAAVAQPGKAPLGTSPDAAHWHAASRTAVMV